MTRFDFDNLIPPTFVCDMEVYLKNLINNTDPTTYTGYSSLGKNTIKTIEFGADGLQYDVYKQFYQYRANYSDDSSKIISVLASDYTQAKALAKFLLFAKRKTKMKNNFV